MFGSPPPPRQRPHDEPEKPFWISYSDLMTALMVLFLVAMAVALLSVTQGLRQMDDTRLSRQNAIQTCLDGVNRLIQRPEFNGVQLRGATLDLGPLAEFAKDSDALAPLRAAFLRAFVPPMLEVARTPECQAWLKRFVLEGYASPEGSYLYNLQLSLARSQRVLCVLLDGKAPDALLLDDRKAIRALFLVGGSSFNSAILNQPEKSRRVELRLEFLEQSHSCTASTPTCKASPAAAIPWDEDSACPLMQR